MHLSAQFQNGMRDLNNDEDGIKALFDRFNDLKLIAERFKLPHYPEAYLIIFSDRSLMQIKVTGKNSELMSVAPDDASGYIKKMIATLPEKEKKRIVEAIMKMRKSNE